MDTHLTLFSKVCQPLEAIHPSILFIICTQSEAAFLSAQLLCSCYLWWEKEKEEEDSIFEKERERKKLHYIINDDNEEEEDEDGGGLSLSRRESISSWSAICQTLSRFSEKDDSKKAKISPRWTITQSMT